MAGCRIPRLTARMIAYALAGLFGLLCAIIGASGLIAGKGTILAGFPATLAEAVACGAGGVVVCWWAAARFRREITRQGACGAKAGRHSAAGTQSESGEEAEGES